MNLKSWSWELNFWILLVLWGSGSHRWFSSPKQISGFHNQNPRENLNRTSFARTSWFLVKVHIKTSNCRITLFEQFRILKWRNKPQKWNLHENLGKIGTSWKFWLFGQYLCKSQLLETGHLRNFWATNEETGPKIGMCSKNWVGQVRFENFDFLVKVKGPLGQSIFFSLFFFFFFFWGGSDRVRFPGRSGSNRVSLVKSGSVGWRHPWRHAQRARVSTWRVELVAGWGGAWNCVDDAEARGGAWLIF